MNGIAGHHDPANAGNQAWRPRSSYGSLGQGMKARFAVCVDNSEYPASLEVHKIYRVVPDKDAEQEGDVRIIDESGEDYLYPGRYFVEIDGPQETERDLIGSYDRI